MGNSNTAKKRQLHTQKGCLMENFSLAFWNSGSRVWYGTYIADLTSQKGKMTSLRRNQEMTKSENIAVARVSCPTYCANFAASKQMSLGSWRIMTTDPILVYLWDNPSQCRACYLCCHSCAWRPSNLLSRADPFGCRLQLQSYWLKDLSLSKVNFNEFSLLCLSQLISLNTGSWECLSWNQPCSCQMVQSNCELGRAFDKTDWHQLWRRFKAEICYNCKIFCARIIERKLTWWHKKRIWEWLSRGGVPSWLQNRAASPPRTRAWASSSHRKPTLPCNTALRLACKSLTST